MFSGTLHTPQFASLGNYELKNLLMDFVLAGHILEITNGMKTMFSNEK